jgi:hypothetical protein
MRMPGVGVGHCHLRDAVSFGAGMEAAHPADLMSADTLRRSCHPFWAEIRAVGKYTGQHGGDVLGHIAGPDVGELIRKPSPFMHFPQKIWDLDQRIRLCDFGIQRFGCGRYIAGKRDHDQRAILHPHTIEFPETGLPG